MKYDLLIKGGHLLDPGQGLDGVADIATTGGKIAAIGSVDASDAQRVIEVRGDDRYVVPGLIDLHTHVAFGGTTTGVGMGTCRPDDIGVRSGVTTVVDCGSVGVANVGVFPAHILPNVKTRTLCYLNVGSYAHTMPGLADVNSLDDINRSAIDSCFENNPGLISGIKLRLVGPIMSELGEQIVIASKAIARDHDLPLMVHIGDFAAKAGTAHADRIADLTRFLLGTLETGDILTHLCTPQVGRVLDAADRPLPELWEARASGVVLDSALGRGNFGYEVASRQAQLGLLPDTISSDLTAMGQTFHSLVECMAKFMAIGYSFADVVKMTTVNAARAIGLESQVGALAVGRDADITILDLVGGDFQFIDTTEHVFRGRHGIVPVYVFRGGEEYSPGWGTHPWGWLPELV